jgi:DnaJ like chaperone protein
MIWYGKLIGALLGAILMKHPLGALVGAVAGHYLFDLQAMRGQSGGGDQRAIQAEFFRVTFQTMGHVAKADGRVSEEDIRAARTMMSHLRLGEAEVRVAIELFTEGKARDFPLDESLARLHALLGNRLDLRRMFVQIQLQAALWSGAAIPARPVLLRACGILGISEFEFAQMEALLRMQQAGASYSSSGGTYSKARPQRDVLSDAYSVLGLQSTASDGDVTKAYRRLMSQNHPDKLAANGLPESMKTVAEEKTRQIREAYEAIREARGMK